MLSQAIESVTRVFYARADLDLIMSSPVRLTNVFSVRIAAIALTHRTRRETKYQNPNEQVKVSRADRLRIIDMPLEKKE